MVVVALLVFLGLYTWNIRSGYLDVAVEHSGMEVVGLFLSPMHAVKSEVKGFWNNYIDLRNARVENEFLQKEVARLSFELIQYKEIAIENAQLQKTLAYTSPAPWPMSAARVMAWRMGPFSALETFLVDRGSSTGVTRDDPVMTHTGVVGRVIRVAPSVSTVMMLTDLNSRIAVRGEKTRSTGILAGSGPGEPLRVLYVPVTTVMEEGETLLTSGLDGMFPPGLPVAVITSIQRADRSQFQAITAASLVDLQKLEHVMLLQAPEPKIDELAAQELTPPPAPVVSPEEEANASGSQGNATSSQTNATAKPQPATGKPNRTRR